MPGFAALHLKGRHILEHVHSLQCCPTPEPNAGGSVSSGPGGRSDLGHAQVTSPIFPWTFIHCCGAGFVCLAPGF